MEGGGGREGGVSLLILRPIRGLSNGRQNRGGGGCGAGPVVGLLAGQLLSQDEFLGCGAEKNGPREKDSGAETAPSGESRGIGVPGRLFSGLWPGVATAVGGDDEYQGAAAAGRLFSGL